MFTGMSSNNNRKWFDWLLIEVTIRIIIVIASVNVEIRL